MSMANSSTSISVTLTYLPNCHLRRSFLPNSNSKSKPTRIRCESTISPARLSTQSNLDGALADAVVVGGGISGLCIAQALATKHPNAAPNLILTEATDRVGGNITTIERDGYLWEEGPNSFQPSDPMLTMAVDSGLKEELVLGDPTAPRFVLWNGKLRPVPSSPKDLPFFDLMSIPGKLRAGFGALGIRPPPPGHEESVEEFVRRNLGDEVFERLIEPFCSGVYAGDPSKLSMKAAFGKVWKLEQIGGSIIGGTFKAIQERNQAPKTPRDPRLPKPKGQTVGSFRKGLAMLPNAISSRLGSKVKLSWKLSSISKLDNGGYSLTYETPEGLVTLQTKSVIFTVPSHVASSLLRPLSVMFSPGFLYHYGFHLSFAILFYFSTLLFCLQLSIVLNSSSSCSRIQKKESGCSFNVIVMVLTAQSFFPSLLLFLLFSGCCCRFTGKVLLSSSCSCIDFISKGCYST
uniref:protoporphyrinogen oxidase n=1 Tax=Cannabis sativa TaxID=3483 RepID=A0A803NQ31_CANSA